MGIIFLQIYFVNVLDSKDGKILTLIYGKKLEIFSLEKEKEYYGIITGSDKFQKSLRSCRSNINNVLMRDEIKVKIR